jgi:hypothetical protein
MHNDWAAKRAAFSTLHERQTEGRPGDPAGARLLVLPAQATQTRADDGLSHGMPPVQVSTVTAETQIGVCSGYV